MGQKIHPESFRRVINKQWKSVWHADRDFRNLLEEDTKIRDFIRRKVSSAGIDDLVISRSSNDVRIDLTVARPGLVIGRGGATVTALKKELTKMVGGKLTLDIHEIEAPKLSPEMAVESIVGAFERRYPYKRAVSGTIHRVMEAGAKGIKVFVSGRLGGQPIARREKSSQGSVPTSTLEAKVRYADGFARTKKGTVGVKVWITQPEEDA